MGHGETADGAAGIPTTSWCKFINRRGNAVVRHRPYYTEPQQAYLGREGRTETE